MPFEQTGEWPLGAAANDALALIESRIPAIDVASVMPNERIGPSGDLVDVMDVGFVIPPNTNIYYVHPPSATNWVKLALHSISLRANIVLSIYQGLTERADIIPLLFPLPDDYPGGVIPGQQAA